MQYMSFSRSKKKRISSKPNIFSKSDMSTFLKLEIQRVVKLSIQILTRCNFLNLHSDTLQQFYYKF